MRRKQVLWGAVVAASTVAIIAMAQIRFVSAQQSGEAGVGGVGGAGGAGGGGGGGFNGGSGGGALSAYGDYVYVLQQGSLYQFAAYDLRLVKKSDLGGNAAINRGRRGQAGARGGDGAPGEAGGVGGRGGDGGAGGGFDYGEGASGRSEDVAAFGEFVYVLQGKTLRKLYADGLKPMKVVTLDFGVNAKN
jgi:hypothetical protein